MKRKAFLATAVALFALGAIGISYGAMEKENDALGITTSKTSLVEAITTAEKYVGGVASRAEYEQDKGHGVFEVEIVKGASVTEVMVSASNGKVTGARPDTDDHEDHEDDEN